MNYFTGTKKEIEDNCQKEFDKKIMDFIDKKRKEENKQSNLIEILHMIQKEYGYLPEKKLEALSYLMEIPLSKITGVASFYHFFNLKKMGKYIISVCLGTACHVKGADKILQKLQAELGIKIGETTKDGLFTLQQSRCLGACALAPIIKINDKIYSKVTADDIAKILEKYFNS